MPEVSEPSDEKKLQIATARSIVIQSLGDNLLRICLSKKHNPFRMWILLTDRYAVPNIATRFQIQSRFSNLRYGRQRRTDFIN